MRVIKDYLFYNSMCSLKKKSTSTVLHTEPFETNE